MSPLVAFFGAASVMVVVAVLWLVIPMLRARVDPADSREQQNVLIARERLAELEQRLSRGELDADQAEQERAQIEIDLVAELEDQSAGDAAGLRRGVWAGIAVALFTPIAAGMLYLSLGRPEILSTAPVVTDQTDTQQGHSDAQMLATVQRLEASLSEAPDNAEGWYLLGSSYMTLGRYAQAAVAFEKLRSMVGDDPDLLVRQADALAMASDGNLAGQPERLLEQALAAAPDHPVALWLGGIAAERRGDLAKALNYWERAEPLFSTQPGSQAELRALITAARAQLDSAGGDASGQMVASSAEAVDSAAGLTVRVSLDQELMDDVTGDETLFVLARPVSGPAMPLAVVRDIASSLPIEVTLDDSMAMMPTMKLSDHDQVTVVAKLSRSGNAITGSGDLIGEVSPVRSDRGDPVQVVIASRVP